MLSLTPLVAGETGFAPNAASGASALMWLAIALPALGAAVLLLGGRALDKIGPILATAMSWLAFLVGLLATIQLMGLPKGGRSQRVELFEWVSTGRFHLDAALQVDPLSLSFVLLITFVGSLIHVYSLGYMAHDVDKRRFFAYLNLFVAAMLTLVLADSYLGLFLGWEGVGLASYLLIGFWNYRPDYATAANKAFIVNRVGDFGLLIAMFLIFHNVGALDFKTVFAKADVLSTGMATAICLALLVGACGKSAQFPLQSWLGDAMAGPTPVSALIHAATMVTAGVYLVTRSHALFEQSPNAQLAVTVVGAITLVMGAIIGCAKDDMKKTLAASTMSQIGYMMLAAGLGPVGYVFAIFHLLTHGFFKAGMFLGAGSVMHGMNDEVNMRGFGGLSKHMKITWLTFMMGWLAIIGFPLLSGFWSKDKIIEAAFVGEGWRPWVFGMCAMLAAGLTAFYMSRLFFMVFHGKARWDDEHHPHESPLTMTVPMIVLAFGSVFLGAALGVTNAIGHWLEPVFGHHEHGEPVLAVPVITGVTLALMVVGVAVAWMMYGRGTVGAPARNALAVTARNDFFQDTVNSEFFIKPTLAAGTAARVVDDEVVDGAVFGTGRGVGEISNVLRRAQNGFVRSYAMTMLLGVVAILAVMWVVK